MASFFNFLLNAVTRSGLIRFMTLPVLVKEYLRQHRTNRLRPDGGACRIVRCCLNLVVDENTEKKLADKVRQVKKDGLIDNFIYGSVSSTYLSAVIDAL